MKKTANIVFFGTPAFSLSSLKAVVKSGRKVLLVVTQPDRPAGRGMKLKTFPVKEYALEHHLPLLQPLKMKDPTFQNKLKEFSNSIFVVAAYGRILPRSILDLSPITLNVHGSLLPRWRGAAPIQRSILAGDEKTGVSIMRLVEEMDAGDYMLQKEIAIEPNETGGELEIRMAEIGAKALVEALDQIDFGKEVFKKQDTFQVTFAPPIKAEEGKIDWVRSRDFIHNQIRAFQPHPGTYTIDGKSRIKIHRSQKSLLGKRVEKAGALFIQKNQLWVACGDGWLEILEIQKEGKARQDIPAFLPGYRVGNAHQWT